MDQRMSKDKYYLNIADAVLDRSTCLRRKYGAIIVKNDEILSTGYNGAPRGRVNCSELGYCNREQLNIPSGQRYELCRSVHAEANAIISAARRDMIGGTLYLVGRDSARHDLVRHVPPHDHQLRHHARRQPHRRRRHRDHRRTKLDRQRRVHPAEGGGRMSAVLLYKRGDFDYNK